MIGTFLMFAVTVLAAIKTPPQYNGKLEYYIADLGPGYPCHPLYTKESTWFDGDDPTGVQIKAVLEQLSAIGFNGIRLPMWPDSP